MASLRTKLKKNEFYCVACRKRTTALDNQVKKTKARVTGQPLLKAKCKRCEKRIAKFVKAE